MPKKLPKRRAALMALAAPVKHQAPILPPEPFAQLRTEREAAAILRWSLKTLQKRRSEGRPPPFIKLGDGKRAPVRYADNVLRQFIEGGQRTSTSESSR